MKNQIKWLMVACMIMLFSEYTSAQKSDDKVVTCEFEVQGVCGMCKSRIENAALIKGVKMAQWDKDTKKMKVIYNTTKTTEDEVHKAIAAVGHDTDKVKATEESKKELPGCCAYWKEGVDTH